MKAADILKGLEAIEHQQLPNRFQITRPDHTGRNKSGRDWLFSVQINGELTAQEEREVMQLVAKRLNASEELVEAVPKLRTALLGLANAVHRGRLVTNSAASAGHVMSLMVSAEQALLEAGGAS